MSEIHPRSRTVSKELRGFTNGKACLMSGKRIVFPVFLLHSFKFIPVAGFPVDIIECQGDDAHSKWDDGEMFIGVHAE